MPTDLRLTDTDIARFLRDGLVLLQPPELDAGFHNSCFAAAANLYDEAKRQGRSTAHLQLLGDNLLAQVPALQELLDAPSVRGALTSVVGEGYVLHPHHFVHAAGRMDQGFHQDGNLPWNTRGYFRSPRPVAAILFYYPQAVTDEMGPTEVLPGTQYWRGCFEDGEQWHGDDHLDRAFNDEAARHPDLAVRDARLAASLDALVDQPRERRRLCVPAGTVALLHYDLVHRGTRQAPGVDARRYMFKFYFLRTQEPRAPSWRNISAQLPGELRASANEPAVASVWQWLRGEQASAPLPGLAESFQPAALAAQLRSPDERSRRAAGYALGDIGPAAVPVLLGALGDDDVTVRRMAAFALGETRCADVAVVDALVLALTDPDSFVRSNTAFALGGLARVRTLPNAAIDALLARLDAAVEPDNTHSAGMSRSTVRECVTQALLMAACNDGLDETQLTTLAARGLTDTGRYVRALTAQALLRAADMDAPPWLSKVMRHLEGAQYQPLPNAPPT